MRGRNPLLLIVEDAHWCDPTSTELLQMLVERASAVPLMVIVSVRTPFDAGWMHHRNVVPVALDRLDDHAASAIVAEIAGGEKPAGGSWSIRSSTRLTASRCSSRNSPRWCSIRPVRTTARCASSLATRAFPATLHDSLAARLDQLSPDKHVAQCAAVIGREFRHDVLSAVSLLPEDGLQGSLGRLDRGGARVRAGCGAASALSVQARDGARRRLR